MIGDRLEDFIVVCDGGCGHDECPIWLELREYQMEEDTMNRKMQTCVCGWPLGDADGDRCADCAAKARKQRDREAAMRDERKALSRDRSKRNRAF